MSAAPSAIVSHLSERQIEVLKLWADGVPGKEIAFKLGISEQTVKNHKGMILFALGIDNITQVVKYAIAHGITTADSWKGVA